MRRNPVDWPNAPRPVRRWGNGEEFGVKDATEEERKKVLEGDILLWRMVFLATIDDSLKKARMKKERMAFALE